MKMALNLAKMTNGQTGKNPPVGAVIVKDGSIIGMGAHFGYGQPHAERQALASCNADPAGADIYVTLEPCSHHGKTPPCTDAIIEAGISNVFYAEQDLNPKVSGHNVLAAAGVNVEHMPNDEAKALYSAFFNHLRKGRPNITLKCAMSVDGKLALNDGTSKWITGSEARLDVHNVRHVHDAILVGGQTLLNDNPRLTTRIESGGRSPKPVVLLGGGELRDDLEIFRHSKRPVVYTTNRDNLKYEDRCEVKIGDWSLTAVLQDLYEMKLTSLFVEGGSSVITSFIKEKLYDQIFLYIAPKIFGESTHTLYREEILSMDEAVQLELVDVEKLGPDLKITYRKA